MVRDFLTVSDKLMNHSDILPWSRVQPGLLQHVSGYVSMLSQTIPLQLPEMNK